MSTVYRRPVHYYETDQMKIVHHSNYIRWFEEARIDFFERAGISFARLESTGIVCPVLSVEAHYQQMVRFGETVAIETTLCAYSGVRLGFRYVVKNAADEVCCTGESTHCFLKPDGGILRPRREHPELDRALLARVELGSGES